MHTGFSNMEGTGNVTRSVLGREGELLKKLMKWRRESVVTEKVCGSRIQKCLFYQIGEKRSIGAENREDCTFVYEKWRKFLCGHLNSVKDAIINREWEGVEAESEV